LGLLKSQQAAINNRTTGGASFKPAAVFNHSTGKVKNQVSRAVFN